VITPGGGAPMKYSDKEESKPEHTPKPKPELVAVNRERAPNVAATASAQNNLEM
jgi:hypothetical protein